MITEVICYILIIIIITATKDLSLLFYSNHTFRMKLSVYIIRLRLSLINSTINLLLIPINHFLLVTKATDIISRMSTI